MKDVSLTVDEEFREVPVDSFAEKTLCFGFEESKDSATVETSEHVANSARFLRNSKDLLVRRISVDLTLLHKRKGDTVVELAEALGTLIVLLVLVSELIARET